MAGDIKAKTVDVQLEGDLDIEIPVPPEVDVGKPGGSGTGGEALQVLLVKDQFGKPVQGAYVFMSVGDHSGRNDRTTAVGSFPFSGYTDSEGKVYPNASYTDSSGLRLSSLKVGASKVGYTSFSHVYDFTSGYLPQGWEDGIAEIEMQKIPVTPVAVDYLYAKAQEVVEEIPLVTEEHSEEIYYPVPIKKSGKMLYASTGAAGATTSSAVNCKYLENIAKLRTTIGRMVVATITVKDAEDGFLMSGLSITAARGYGVDDEFVTDKTGVFKVVSAVGDEVFLTLSKEVAGEILTQNESITLPDMSIVAEVLWTGG